MKNKSICFILFLFLITSCRYKKANFSVDTPKGWRVEETLDKEGERKLKNNSPVIDSEGNYPENIIIGINRFNDPAEYATKVLKGFRQEADFCKEIRRGTIEIDGRKAYWAEHLVRLNLKSDTVEQKVYFIGDRGHVYRIVCSAGMNGFKTIEKEIKLVTNTFKIRN